MAAGPAGAARQDTLFGPAPRRRRGAAAGPGAGPDGATGTPVPGLVAHVAVDLPHPHLDHPFTYAVPDRLAGELAVGSRVQVPFAGGRHDGWVLATGTGDVTGLRPVRRVVGPLPVLTAEVAGLARAVADTLAGTLPDVLRSAVPPRHARAEKELLAARAAGAEAAEESPGPVAARDADATTATQATSDTPATTDEPGPWQDVVGGEAFLVRLRGGGGPCAAVRPPVTAGTGRLVADAVAAARAGDRGAVVVAPDVVAVEAVLAGEPGLAADPGIAVLHHDLGPAARWRAFVRVLRGEADVVLGTRSAVFAPVQRLGAVVVLDDGDDGHVEPHAPGWDSSLVALMRAERAGAALALVSTGRPVRTQAWVQAGRLRSLAPERAVRRRSAPRVVVPDPDDPVEAAARVPSTVLRVLREALASGPVLVQVARSGWVTSLRCQSCRAPARCARCAGPLARPAADAPPTCAWCALPDSAWACPACGADRLRAGSVGAARSAEELGRAFPGVPLVLSSGGQRRTAVPARPAVVVATPGAEPRADDGYAAAAVLDGDLALARAGLTVEEETLRRWTTVAGLVRPAPSGGRLVVVADPSHRAVQALVQDAPEALADRLLEERAQAGLPPVTALARLTGSEQVLSATAAVLRGEDVLAVAAGPPPRVRVLGPAPTGTVSPGPPGTGATWQLLVTGVHEDVVRAVHELLTARSAAKASGRLLVRVDPHDLV